MNQPVQFAPSGDSLNPKLADVTVRLGSLPKEDLRLAMQECARLLDCPVPSAEVKPPLPDPGVPPRPVRKPVLERLLTESGPSIGVQRTDGEVAEWVRSGPFCRLVGSLEDQLAPLPSGPGRKQAVLRRVRDVADSWTAALHELLHPGG